MQPAPGLLGQVEQPELLGLLLGVVQPAPGLLGQVVVVEPMLVELQEQSLRLLTVEQQEQSLGLLWEEQQEQSVGLLCGKQQEEQSLGPPWEEPLQACSLQGALWVVQPEPWLQGPVEQPELWLLQLLLLLLCVLWPQPCLQGQGEQLQPWLVVVGVVAHCGCCCGCCCCCCFCCGPGQSRSRSGPSHPSLAGTV